MQIFRNFEKSQKLIIGKCPRPFLKCWPILRLNRKINFVVVDKFLQIGRQASLQSSKTTLMWFLACCTSMPIIPLSLIGWFESKYFAVAVMFIKAFEPLCLVCILPYVQVVVCIVSGLVGLAVLKFVRCQRTQKKEWGNFFVTYAEAAVVAKK